MGSESRNSCARTRGSARDHEQRSQNNRAARSPNPSGMQGDGRARRQPLAGCGATGAQRRRTQGSSNLACRQASQSWRDHRHARYFRLCRQRAAAGVALRADPIRPSPVLMCRVDHAAGAGARPVRLLRRSISRLRRSMDAFEFEFEKNYQHAERICERLLQLQVASRCESSKRRAEAHIVPSIPIINASGRCSSCRLRHFSAVLRPHCLHCLHLRLRSISSNLGRNNSTEPRQAM